MMSFLRRAYARVRPRRKPGTDVEAAVPLVHLLEEAEPTPDMFERIEARLDSEPTRPRHMRRWIVLLSFLSGLGAGVLAVHLGQERQRIVARPTADAAWVPLGGVTLHGAGLRAFVRAKCHGHTHFLITMHGQSPSAPNDPTPPEVPLMAPEEKVLMECIF